MIVDLPSDARTFSLTSFLKSPSLILITESDFLLSVNVMVFYNEFCRAGPSSLVFLRRTFSGIFVCGPLQSFVLRIVCTLCILGP